MTVGFHLPPAHIRGMDVKNSAGSRSRTPKGIPAGGQFAVESKAEPLSSLCEPSSSQADEAPDSTQTAQKAYSDLKPTDRVIEECWACHGTGIYNAPTGYTDGEGRPFCFKCDGHGSHSVLVSSIRAREAREAKDALRRRKAVTEAFAANNRIQADLTARSESFAEAVQSAGRLHDEAMSLVYRARDFKLTSDQCLADWDEIGKMFTPKVVGPNTFPGSCAECKQRVHTRAGVMSVTEIDAANDNERTWETDCQTHNPDRDPGDAVTTPARTTPAPEGRVNATGRIIATRDIESTYGTTTKLTIEDDSGYTFEVTEPEALFDAFQQVEGQRPAYDDWITQQKVSMAVRLKPDQDDPTFAKGSRPTKLHVNAAV